MEDRYLFKAKRIDNGEWVQGALFNGENHCIIGKEIKFSPYTEHECKIVGYEVDRDTICQCTGLNDKNGKLIWENDILKYEWDGKERIDVIKYEAPIFTYSKSMRWSLQKDEVIGNKFDNPELLEVGE